MSVTRVQAIANTREMMDAVSSTRWSDAFITTVLGIVSGREWSGLLSANPYYRFAQRSVTASSTGTVLYTALSSGVGDSAQNWSRILSITDGQYLYRQTSFMADPLATTDQPAATIQAPQWYDAGQSFQILPVGATALTVSVNWTPPRVDQLSADSVTIDFPDGSETILWLEAASYLLSKGGAENEAAQTMRAMADQERQQLYSNIARRGAQPITMAYNDRASEWGG
jgi:hypothetical protein